MALYIIRVGKLDRPRRQSPAPRNPHNVWAFLGQDWTHAGLAAARTAQLLHAALRFLEPRDV